MAEATGYMPLPLRGLHKQIALYQYGLTVLLLLPLHVGLPKNELNAFSNNTTSR